MNSTPLLEWVAPPPAYPDGIPPEVCRLFESVAGDLRRRGFARYSADAILHRLRWEFQVERGNRGFKLDNDWAAPLARWFLSRNPGAGKFFELRERRKEVA